jgi:hypothetical protein
MPEQNQNVSFPDHETINHNFSQNLTSTEMQPLFQNGFSISEAHTRQSKRTLSVQIVHSRICDNLLSSLLISISEAIGISQNGYYIQCPLLPSVSSSCNGETTLSQGQDSLLAPRLINLETSGLRQSSWIAALNRVTRDNPAITAYTSSTTQLKSRWITSPKPSQSFLSVFNSVGTQWNFTTLNPHSEHEHLSFVAQIANDFEQINSLFDNTINAKCHQIQAYTTSNESFKYSQMLHEADHTKFFEAMEIEITDHNARRHMGSHVVYKVSCGRVVRCSFK